jgi:hypothetical protein
MAEVDQEDFLKSTSLKDIIVRGLKKLITEITSIKTLFLGFLCVARAYGWVTDTWLIVGGLAVLGVKEIPTDVFSKIIDKFTK